MKKDPFIDEKIIRLRNFCDNRTKTYNILTDAVSICGNTMRFAPVYLFDGKVCAVIPDNFIRMPEAIAEIKYINNYRPPVIWTSSSYEENFGFHLLNWKDIGSDSGLDRLIWQMQDTVIRHAPETVLYEQGSIQQRAQGRWFEYKNFTVDDETYNLQFLIDFGEALIAGTFNCRMCVYDQWKTPVLKTLECMEMEEKGVLTDEGRQITYFTV